jgi:hypothetical protein
MTNADEYIAQRLLMLVVRIPRFPFNREYGLSFCLWLTADSASRITLTQTDLYEKYLDRVLSLANFNA